VHNITLWYFALSWSNFSLHLCEVNFHLGLLIGIHKRHFSAFHTTSLWIEELEAILVQRRQHQDCKVFTPGSYNDSKQHKCLGTVHIKGPHKTKKMTPSLAPHCLNTLVRADTPQFSKKAKVFPTKFLDNRIW